MLFLRARRWIILNQTAVLHTPDTHTHTHTHTHTLLLLDQTRQVSKVASHFQALPVKCCMNFSPHKCYTPLQLLSLRLLIQYFLGIN
jgi:hypothetical protein